MPNPGPDDPYIPYTPLDWTPGAPIYPRKQMKTVHNMTTTKTKTKTPKAALVQAYTSVYIKCPDCKAPVLSPKGKNKWDPEEVNTQHITNTNAFCFVCQQPLSLPTCQNALVE